MIASFTDNFYLGLVASITMSRLVNPRARQHLICRAKWGPRTPWEVTAHVILARIILRRVGVL